MSKNTTPKNILKYLVQELKSRFAEKSEIPSVNNNTITIQLNGTTVETFTLNQNTDETINIQVTKASVGLGNVGNFYAVSTAENQGLSNLQKKNARDNINAANDEAPNENYVISNHQITYSTESIPTTVNSFITKLRTLVINVMDNIRTWLNAEIGFNYPALGTDHKFNRGVITQSSISDFSEAVEDALDEVASGFNDHADWIATKADSNSIPTKVSQLTNDSGFITSYTDTKNTAGTTNTTSKIFLAGATSQAANPQTYSNVNCYASGNKLYSNAKEVVNLSDSQSLTNKTYNGYTLAAACAKDIETTLANDGKLPTGSAVIDYLNSNLTFFDIGANTFHKANVDFNNITRSGYYLNTLDVSNRPGSSVWYILLVFRPYKDSNGEVVVQLAFGMSNNKAHFRFKNATTWTSWTALN